MNLRKEEINGLLDELSDKNMASFFHEELVKWSRGKKCAKGIGGMAKLRGLKNGKNFIVSMENGIKHHKPILTEKGKFLINGITHNEEAWIQAVDELKSLS